MRTFLTIAIFAINIFAIALNYKILKEKDKNKILMFIIVEEIILLIIGKIIFNIATKNIDKDVSSTSQNTILFIFQGMNMIIISSPLAKILDDNKNKSFSKRITIWIIVTIIIIVLECIYIKNIENGILNMKR